MGFGPRKLEGIPVRLKLEALLSVGLAAVLVLHFIGAVSGLAWLLPLTGIIGTIPVVISAGRSLLKRDWASMDMLASVALLFSLANNEWTSATFIALMLSTARILSIMTESRAEKGIESLLTFRPEKANVERGETMREVPLAELRQKDIVLVSAGDRIPVDGSVLSGEAAVNESALTGESVPVEKEIDSQVFSGTLVESGGLRIRTEKVGKDTTLEKIIELVKSSRAEQSKIHTLAETFGKLYLVGIIVFAAVLFYFTKNTNLVLAVILVVCADDVAIAIPLTYLGAIGSSAKRGVIVKGSAHLEALGRAKIFVFDKTGTLTKGALSVSEMHCVGECPENELLKYSAIASRGSKHPVSRAVVAYAESHGAEPLFPSVLKTTGGKGTVATYQDSHIVMGRMSFIESEGIPVSEDVKKQAALLGDEGKSITLTARNGKVLGIIALEDEVKEGAAAALAALKRLGATDLIMLTGDNEHVAKVVAERTGITEFHAGLLPEDKVAWIQKLRKRGDVVMAGDGVNDAAALASATVGVAMGAIGYDTAIESANIVLMTDDLDRLVDTARLARRVQKIAIEDFWIWGITNAAGLFLVFDGVIGPAGAAAYNFISDFFPLSNSLRAWVSKNR